ncbi:MAG: class I SAM-dependent methyltransferase [Stenotrophobium sp.]
MNQAVLKGDSEDYYGGGRPEVLKFFTPGPRRILDVGCGSGNFGAGLKARLGAEVWGIEYQAAVAERAHSRLDKVYAGDVMQLVDMLPPAHFDLIVFNDVLEHLADPYQLLVKIKRCMTPDGRIFCSIPNFLYFNALRTLLIHKDFKYEDSGIFDRTHLRFFTRKSIVRMFDELDYDLELIEGINPKRHWVFRLLNILLLNALSESRYLQYACVARPRVPVKTG